MSSAAPVLLDVADSIATITLNRPDKRNAMNGALHQRMTEILEEVRYRDDARVVVITGAGPAFCAGMDLKEIFSELKDDQARFDRVYRMATEWRSRTLRHFPKPTIAMVNGFCFGGAFSIVESCDIAFAADEAKFALSEINFMGFPGGSVSKSMANLFRPRDALLYALTGRPFEGREAERIGLVTSSVPFADLRTETYAVAAAIAEKDPVALKATKDAYRYSLEMPMDAALNYSAAKEAELTHRQKDLWRNEGIDRFLDGTYKPGLSGK